MNGRIVTIHERNECITDPNMLASKLYRVEPVPQDQVRSCIFLCLPIIPSAQIRTRRSIDTSMPL